MGDKISIKVVPNAPKSAVVGLYGDALKIKIAAQPQDGKANVELVKFLSKALCVARRDIRIISGDTSHSKLVEIEGAQNCRERLLKMQ